MSDWKFELIRSYDLSRIGELTQARGRSLTLTLNKAGGLSFNLPLDDAMAVCVQEIKTGVMLSFQGTPVWSGAIWTVEEEVSSDSARMTVNCVGWLQTLDKRVIRPSWNSGNAMIYTSVEPGFIALDLISRSNQDAFAASAQSYVIPGTYEGTIPRSRTYQPWTGVLGAIEELTQVESGFDMYLHPVTRKLNIVALKMRSTNCFFELGNNVRRVSRQTDSGRITTAMDVFSSSGYQQVIDTSAASEYGLMEEAVSLSDVVDNEILLAYAAEEVNIKSRPLPIITFEPMMYSLARDANPRPFRDYDVGDLVYLTAVKGRMNIKRQAMRLFSYTINFDENGSEQVTGIQAVAS